MLVRQQTFHAAQEKIQRLERELEQARVSLARYKDQERELVEAVVAARVEAREVRSRAEIEARSVLGGAREEATKINAEARAQLAAAQAEIARLRNVQHELSNSLDESLTALKGVLPSAASPLPDREAAPRVAGPPAPEILGVFSTTARLSTTTDARQDWQAGGAPVYSAAGHEASPSRRMPVDRAVAQRDGPPRLGPSGSRDVLAFWTSRKTLLRVAGAALALVCLALAAGGARWWRGSATDADAMANEPGVVDSDVKNSPNATAKRAPKAEGATKLHSGASAGPASSHVRVALRAVRPVWLRVEVDGKQTTARLMRAGEELNLQGARNVTVRSGDAGALLIAINGAAHTTFGRDGTALTRRVTTGHLPPTPAAPPRPLAAAATPGAPASSQLPSIALASKSSILRPPLHASPVEPKPPVEPVAPLNGAKPPMLAQSAAGHARHPSALRGLRQRRQRAAARKARCCGLTRRISKRSSGATVAR